MVIYLIATHFNHGLFNHELCNPVEVDEFMVEKSGVDKSRVETWGWKFQGLDVLQPNQKPFWEDQTFKLKSCWLCHTVLQKWGHANWAESSLSLTNISRIWYKLFYLTMKSSTKTKQTTFYEARFHKDKPNWKYLFRLKAAFILYQNDFFKGLFLCL